MTGTEIISRFNLQVDDASELSDAEGLDLANEIYEDVQQDRPWEWLKKVATGSTSISVAYITLPTDFKTIAPNKDERSIVFVGSEYREYEVIAFEDRREHRDQDGFCYLDMVNRRLYFTKQPTSVEAIEYDYIMVAPELELATSPIFRDGFHRVISYGMAARFNPIEITDKSTSYRRENYEEYLKLLSNMGLEDANLKLRQS